MREFTINQALVVLWRGINGFLMTIGFIVKKKQGKLMILRMSHTKTNFCGKLEKAIYLINAIFEGIGMAGILSAACWYATAPIAPDGFKGPIATTIIATTTLMSLLIAIPIAYFAYRKILHNLKLHYISYDNEVDTYLNNLTELQFDLLHARIVMNSDAEYYNTIRELLSYKVIKDNTLIACQVFSNYKNKQFEFKYVRNNVFLCETRGTNGEYFADLMHKFGNIKSIRSAIVKQTFKTTNLDPINDSGQPITYGKSFLNAFVGGIICTEVLLSIVWTVASIFIGTHIIEPIHPDTWIIYAVMCLLAGPFFGLGIFFNQNKQQLREQQKKVMVDKNNSLNELRIKLDVYLTQKKSQNQVQALPVDNRFLALF